MTLRSPNLVAAGLLGLALSACTGGGFAGGGKKTTKPVDLAPAKQPTAVQAAQKPNGQVADQTVPPQTAGQQAQGRPGADQQNGVFIPAEIAKPSTDTASSATPPPAGLERPPQAQPVQPASPIPPSAAKPDDAESVGQLRVPTTCYVNMEQGYHGTDEDYIVQISDAQGVVAAGKATIEAVRNGEPNDGHGAYPGVVLNYDLSYVRPGATSGAGELNVCYSDPNVAPEKGKCVQKTGQFGGGGDRPAAIQGERASWTISKESGKAQIAVEGDFNLSTHHPVWAYAAPGKCFKDFQSPLMLDLDGNGRFDLVDVWNDATQVRFDLMNQGKKTRTGWVAPGDGLLALDLDGSGTIDQGLELFGEYTKGPKAASAGDKSFDNGFKALAQYDSNDDGVIDAKDPIFAKLVVWKDLNQDGISQKGELQTLAQAGIRDLSLAYEKTGNLAPMIVQNNEVRLVSTFHTKDGKAHPMADVWFKQRRFTDGQVAKVSSKK